MKFSVDHHFVIGDDHAAQGKPCQDHALSACKDGIAVAVVSDGCSSGGETDMGARVLTFATLRAILVHFCVTHALPGVEAVEEERALIESTTMNMLGLYRDDMLATSIATAVTDEGGFVYLAGDGVIAVTKRDGSIELLRFDWARNMPAYPHYRDDQFAAFIAAQGGDSEGELMSRERVIRYADGTETEAEMLGITLALGIRGVTLNFDAHSIAEEIASIAVFTDGVTHIDGVDWKDAACELLSFKNTTGAFVKRRMNAALKKYRKEGKSPLDDLAYAVISIDQPREGEDYESREQNA